MTLRHSVDWSSARRDVRPAVTLFALGLVFFVPSLVVRGGHPMFAWMAAFALMPLAAAAIVLLLPRPRNLLVRLMLALLTGTATALAMARLVTLSN